VADKEVIGLPYDGENPPTPFNDKLPEYEGLWPHEKFDSFIPSGGFVRDFVLATRGHETTTRFAIWTALLGVSAALRRDAYLDWPKPLFPNLFVILVASPGVARKSFTINWMRSLLYRMHNCWEDEYHRFKYQVNVFAGSITSEGLQEYLKPKEQSVRKGNGIGHVDRGSQIAMFASELKTSLPKKNYMEGIIGKLTDLYDCEEDPKGDYTKKDKEQEVRNVYITFIGGTTPDDLEKVLPEEVFGGGFMSRTVVVYENKPERIYPEPIEIPHAPTNDELTRRLAWISKYATGAYTLSEKAREVHHEWYRKHYKISLSEMDHDERLSRTRYDTILMRLALLVRAQRYEPGTTITLDDYLEAKKILDNTYHESENEVQKIGNSEYAQNMNRIRNTIQKHGEITRAHITSRMSRYARVSEINELLEHLKQIGEIKVLRDGEPSYEITSSTKESYVWAKAR
jgi:hypothetical protein